MASRLTRLEKTPQPVGHALDPGAIASERMLMGHSTRRAPVKRTALAIGLAAATAFSLVACGGGSSAGGGSSSGGAQIEGSGSLDGGGKTLMVFMPSTSNIYLKDFLTALQEEASAHNYKTQVIQNNFDQTEEDQQVQQYISSGQKPAAIIWWPADAKAGVNSARQLSRIAPVIQTDQNIYPGAEASVTMYSGVNQGQVAFVAGEQALKAREDAEKAGRQFHSPDGNLLEFSFTTGYQAGVDRHEQFLEATKSRPFNLLNNEPVPTLDAQGGFTAASQIIPKYKEQGIDFVFCQNNNMCVGVVKALAQNGLTPGKDVTVVAGDLSGDPTPWKNGEIYSAVIQSPKIEGYIVVDSTVQYLATGKVTEGTQEMEATADKPEVTQEAPHYNTFMPLAPAYTDTIDQLQLWGLKYGEFGAGS
jgi:ABC-type sugar transport system substrate-binding protein